MLLPSYLLWLRSALPELTTNQYIESTKYLPIFLMVPMLQYPLFKREKVYNHVKKYILFPLLDKASE